MRCAGEGGETRATLNGEAGSCRSGAFATICGSDGGESGLHFSKRVARCTQKKILATPERRRRSSAKTDSWKRRGFVEESKQPSVIGACDSAIAFAQW